MNIMNAIIIIIVYILINYVYEFNLIWGLGIGDWGLGIGPNPQSPIPNPQSPINMIIIFNNNSTHNIIII